MTIRSIAAVLAVAACAVTGCLLTGTKVFSVEIDDLTLDGAAFTSADVDLLRNSTYEEHRDDIERIDRVGLEGMIVNRGANDVTLSVWVSEDPNLATIPDITTNARRILRRVPVAGGERRPLEYDDILRDLENRDALEEAVESGSFAIYAVSDTGSDLDVTLFDLVLVVTFTVSL